MAINMQFVDFQTPVPADWLNDVNNVANVGVNAKTMGAVGDGIADDTIALQNAINLAQSMVRPGSVIIPPGVYKISSSLIITAGVRIIGCGINATLIQPAASVTAFAISTNQPTGIEDLYIQHLVPQNTGLFAITCTAPVGTTNSASKFRNLQISGADSGIEFTNTAFFWMDSCFIENFTNCGVFVSNAGNIDVGDSTIINSTFFNFNVFAGSGIVWESSGGLRVANNKFGALFIGIDFRYATNVGSVAPNTAQLLVLGNSFDTMTNAAVSIRRLSNTDIFNSVLIINNVMPNCGSGVSVPLDSFGSVWLSSVIISNNAWSTPGSGINVGFQIQSTSNINITNNTLFSQSPNSVGITVGNTVSGGLIQLNNLASSSTPFSTTISNLGTNVIVANNVT